MSEQVVARSASALFMTFDAINMKFLNDCLRYKSSVLGNFATSFTRRFSLPHRLHAPMSYKDEYDFHHRRRRIFVDYYEICNSRSFHISFGKKKSREQRRDFCLILSNCIVTSKRGCNSEHAESSYFFPAYCTARTFNKAV